MTSWWHRHWQIAAALVTLATSLPLIAFAQAQAITPNSAGSASPSGIRLTPALENLSLVAGQNSSSYTISATNNTDQAVTIKLSARDFTSVGTDGQLAFFTKKHKSSAVTQHLLASSLQFSQSQFVLASQATQTISVTIGGIAQLSDGGHYAAVLFGASPVSSNSGQHVQFQQTVGSLLFITTAGQGSYSLALTQLHASAAWFSLPASLNLLFTNTGNVQTSPRGYVSVSGPFGTQIKTILNPNSALVLPGTKRLLQTAIGSAKHPFWPGIYTVRVYYRTDNALKYTLTTSHILYFNLVDVVAIIFVFSLAGYLGRTIISGIRERQTKNA